MNSSFLILILLILFYYMYILLNLENIVFFSLSLFKCRIETLNISGAVIKTQCFLFLGLLWYPEMLSFYHWRQFFLILQYMDSNVFLKAGFFYHENLIYAKNTKKINGFYTFLF